MTEEREEKDVYVLLDFQGKDTSKFLQQPFIYFRMLNLNEKKPVVEIGEEVYEGTYDEAVGTNVYFEEVENPPPVTNVFECITPITLQYLLKQTKILKMKKIGIKSKFVVDNSPVEMVNINIKDDYRVLLEKFENNTLNIDDYVSNETVTVEKEEVEHSDTDEKDETSKHWVTSGVPPPQNFLPEWYTEVNDFQKKLDDKNVDPAKAVINPTYKKYAELQKLSKQPTRQKITAELPVEEAELQSMPTRDFVRWKNHVMKKVETQFVNLDVSLDNLDDFVDIEQSIKDRIIAQSDANPRTFTKEEKCCLLSFKNFINVSPLMKLIMIQEFVQIEEASISEMPVEAVERIGEDGCNARQRLMLLKSFEEELKAHIILRVQDAHYMSDECFLESDEFSLKLSEPDDLSYTDTSSSDEDDHKDTHFKRESQYHGEERGEFKIESKEAVVANTEMDQNNMQS